MSVVSEPTSPEPQYRGDTPMLFGRSGVVEALERLLQEADEHAGGAVILHGGPGIGKTAVVAAVEARAAARGMRVLATTGVPSETNLPFAGLHQLVRPLLGGLNRLPAPHREALEAAFGMSAESTPDRFRIALAAL